MQFFNRDGVLEAAREGELLRIESWGKNSLRVRATKLHAIQDTDWALTEQADRTPAKVEIREYEERSPWGGMRGRTEARITNGDLAATVNDAGVITFFRRGEKILREYYRNYDGTISRESRCLKVTNRTWKGILGGTEYRLQVRFEGNDGEKLFGMGQ